MKHGRPAEGAIQGLPGLLARAPIEQVISLAKTRHFPNGATITTGPQLAESAFLVLGGTCEFRAATASGEPQVIRPFMHGETFGCGWPETPPELVSEVVATTDCTILSISATDLAGVAATLDSRDATNSSNSAALITQFHSAPKPTDQLVTLASVSADLPLAWIGHHLAASLRAETDTPVALVRLLRTNGSSAVVDGLLDDRHLPPVNLAEHAGGYHLLRLGVASDARDAVFGELLASLQRAYEYVIVSADSESAPFPILYEAIARSESAYLLAGSHAEDARQLNYLIRELRPRLNSHIPVHLKPVICASETESSARVDEHIELLGLHAHAFVRDCPRKFDALQLSAEFTPTKLFRADIRRLAREIGGRLVGLALSSGGAKGMAHVGVLQVLEENDIEVDVIAGTSMGAYVGALWAFGCDGAQLQKLALEMERKWALWRLVDPVFPPRQGFLQGYAVKRRIQSTIGDVLFSSLPRPLRVVATNLDTLERVVFSSGHVASAVHASVAVPGICVPVVIGDDAYMDGGVSDPLPTDVLKELGARHIIASNTIPSVSSMRRRLEAQRRSSRRGEARARKLMNQFPPLKEQLNYFAEGNILDIFIHSLHGAQIRNAEAACKLAGIVLRPNLSDTRWLDFHTTSKCIAAGREAAERHLDEIKSLVRARGKPHEHTLAPHGLAEAA